MSAHPPQPIPTPLPKPSPRPRSPSFRVGEQATRAPQPLIPRDVRARQSIRAVQQEQGPHGSLSTQVLRATQRTALCAALLKLTQSRAYALLNSL